MNDRESADAEARLRGLFHRLAEREAASAPSFARVLGRARPPRRGGLFRLGLPAAAIAVFVLLAVLLPRAPKAPAPGAAAGPAGAPSLAEWRSPTDFLLRTPASELLESVPPIPETVPDYSHAETSLDEKGTSS
jgi:hypothetical protein